jgi:predicted permease
VSLWRQLTRGLRVLTRRSIADREIDDELGHYLDEATEAFIARGLSPDAARRAARVEIGSTTAVRERVRDGGWENVAGPLFADLRFASRMLRKSPVFTIVMVFVIALGVGAVTTIFSAMNALLLRPLPRVANPAALVALQPARRDGTTVEQGSYARYAHLRGRSHALDGIAAWGRVALTIAVDGDGTSVLGNMVTGNYFDVLGVPPAIGRFFTPDEAGTPGSQPVVVVSHGFWISRLAGDASAIGRSVTINGLPFTIIGVAPETFHGIYTGLRTDAWVPITMQPQLRPRSNLTTASWLWLFGRLRDDVDAGRAQHELSALTAAWVAEAGGSPRPDALVAIRVSRLTGLPNGEGGPLLGFMSLLLGAAGLVLLIAGVNVAAMLSARHLARRREMAVRAALGAGRARLFSQLLTEILTLFVLGALGAFLVTVLATSALERLPLPDNIPVTLELSPDLRVLAFALGVSLATGLVFGLAPALQAARRDITSRLRDDSMGGGVRRTFMGRTLIAGQLALSLVLLVAAGLFLRALDRGQRITTGFDPAGIATATLQPESWGYDEPRARAFYARLRERIAALPGVTAVAYTGRLPLMMGSTPDEIAIDGSADVPVHYASVGVDYFPVLRLPLLQGRAFRDTDDSRGPRVAIVNETLAQRVWPDGSAIGRTFRFRDTPTTVIAIARDAKYASLDESTPAFVYVPLAQVWQPTQALLVRTGADPAGLAGAIQQAALSIDPLLPRPRVTTMSQATAIVLLPQRAAAIVTGVLGGVGLLLATVGLYGVMAFSASRRTREIGIRVALGAGRATVLHLMIREGMRLAAAGIIVGLAIAAAATRLIENWLFSLSPLDAPTFVGMAAIFAAVAFVASYLPARRAAAADPIAALRGD